MLWGNLFQTEAAVTTKAWSPIEERRVAGMCPQFSAHVCCGQNDGWIKMPLGTEVGLGPGHVLDGDPSTPTERGHSSPSFRSMSIIAKRSPISATAEFLQQLVSDFTCNLLYIPYPKAVAMIYKQFLMSFYKLH